MHAYATGSRTTAYGYLAVIAVILALALNAAVDATSFSYGWLLSAPSVGAAFVLLLGAFDTKIWRWVWLRKFGVTSTPVIDGTYEGVAKSTYANTIIPVRLTIDQNWLRILIRFEVVGLETSTSRSAAASVLNEGRDDARVTYTYSNRIKPSFADADMRDHDGAAELVITPSGLVRGRYFNARGRQGDLELQKIEVTAAQGTPA
jgi:hypothetical protein